MVLFIKPMLSVLIITNSYPSVNGPANQIFVRKQAEKLVEFGHEVTVVATYSKRIFPFSLAHKAGKIPLWSTRPFEDIRGMDVHRMYVPILPRKWLSPFYGEILGPLTLSYIHHHIHQRNFDLLHAHVADYGGYIGHWLSKKLDIPFLITTHGGDTDSVVHRSQLHRRAIRRCFAHAEKVICVSRRIQQHVIELGIPPSHTEIVRNGINLEDCIYTPDFLKKKYGEHPMILSVSHLLETKGLQHNLRALRRILDSGRNAFYVIVGEGPFESTLRELANSLNLTNHVAFEGPVKHEDVMRYMSACDVFSMPSWQESFGIVYLEAMLNGKPVIADASQGISDIIINDHNGCLIPSHDVDALTACLTRLLDDKVLADFIGTHGKHSVTEQLTWKQTAIHLGCIYERICQKRQPQRKRVC